MSSVRNLKLEVILSAIDKATGPLKAAMGSSKGLSKAVKDTRDQIKALQRQQDDISSFRKQNTALQDARAKLDAAQAKVRDMRQQMKDGAGDTDKFRKAFTKANEQVRDLTGEVQKQTRQLQPLRSKLTEAGIKASALGSAETSLKGKIESANAALKEQETRLKKVSQRAGEMKAARSRYERSLENRDRIAGAGAGTMAAGATAGAALAVPVNAYAQAEDAAMQLRVSMMERGGKVKKEYAEINALAERLGNRLPGTTAEYQEMMTVLNRQGMSAKAIMGGVGEASAYLAVQLNLPKTAAAEYAAKMQDATGTIENDMMGLMDIIQRTYQVGVDPSNMVNGFAKMAPVLDMIKQKGLAGAKAMAPLLAMADQASLVGESAGNAYRKVFQRSMDAKKVAKGNKLAKGAGIKLDFTNGKGEFGGLDKMFNQLAQLKKLNTQQRNAVIAEIWGDDAETLQALNVMIDKGQAGYREMQQKMANQAALQERVNAQLGTLKNLWDAASGTFTNAMVRFGEAIAPELKAMTEWIANVSERVGNWAKENPGLANTLMKIAGITALVLTGVGSLLLMLAGIATPIIMARLAFKMLGIELTSGLGIIGRLGSALRFGGGMINGFFMLLRANPFLALTAFLTGFVVHFVTNFGRLRQMWTQGDWKGIGLFILQGLEAGLNMMTMGLYGTVKRIIGGMISLVLDILGIHSPSRVFFQIGEFLMAGLVNGITSGLASVKNAITSAGESTIAWFKEKLGIHSPSRVFAELGGFTMEGLHQGIANNQAGPLGAVTSMTKKLTAAGAGIALTAGVAMAGSVPIDQRAPLSAQRAAPGSGVPAQYNITINAAPGMNEQQLAQLVVRQIEQHERQKAARGRSRLTDKD